MQNDVRRSAAELRRGAAALMLQARDTEIVARRCDNETYSEIGRRHHITPQRAWQICNVTQKYHGPNAVMRHCPHLR
jgi:hypothetical protein